MKKLGGDLEGYSEDEEKLVYHYGRPGERLKNAEESVKRFHAGEGPQPPKGIFRSLVQTQSSRLILLVMLAMMAIVILTSIMDRGNGSSTVGLVPVSLTAFSFEDTVYISLQLQKNSKVSHPQPPQVSCNFMLYNTDQQLVHQVELETFYTGTEEFLRTTFGDYDILYVEAVVTVGNETQILRSDITRS
ncbi:MAG: hypothetical protein IKB33_00995 [Spirochaetaceae bacterium]|nr:hypothetical protein [Spirochaetaceae bacterium]